MRLKLKKIWQGMVSSVIERDPDPYDTAIMEKLDGGEYLIKLGNGKKYVGDCTVWHSYPDGKRAGTPTEIKLCDIWQREKWRLQNAPLINVDTFSNGPVIEKFDDSDYVITFPNGKQYVGNGTVWNSYPDGKRASTPTEVKLYEIWQKRDALLHKTKSNNDNRFSIIPEKLTF